MSQIIVETSTPGFSVSRKLDKLGNRSSDTAELFFDDVRVPVSNTIGESGRGFQQQMAQFVIERMFAAYGAVGSCQWALERTRDYVRQREAFGQPLLANQYIGFRLAELSAQVELLQSHNYACAQAYMDGEDITRAATVAKLTAGRLMRRWPTPACSSTAAWATWRRPGLPGSSATPAWPPSAAARTRSCCRCWRGWTGSWHDGDG